MRSQEAVSSMLCPVCRTGLAMSDRSGVEIDYCPTCRGVWLDRGELDKIIERTAAPAERGGTDSRPVDNRSRGSGGLMDMAASMLQGDDHRHDRYYDKHRPKKKKSLLSDFFD